MKLTPELSQAFVNLRPNADFKVFLEHLVREVNDDTEKVLVTEGTACARVQGAVLRLQGIYKAFAEAPAALEKFLAARRQP